MCELFYVENGAEKETCVDVFCDECFITKWKLQILTKTSIFAAPFC